MNRREFLKGLVTTVAAGALNPKSTLLQPNLIGLQDLWPMPTEAVIFVDVILDDGWQECVNIERVSFLVMDNVSVSVGLDLEKLREHVSVIDDTGGKWRIIGDFEGLKGPNGEMIP